MHFKLFAKVQIIEENTKGKILFFLPFNINSLTLGQSVAMRIPLIGH